MSGEVGFDRPLDGSLLALRKLFPGEACYRPHPSDVNVWVARCPACACFNVFTNVFTLTITEFVDERWDRSEVRFDCWAGCDERLIRLCLGIDVPLKRPRVKRLPRNVIPFPERRAA